MRAAGGGRIVLLWGHGCWQVAHGLMDGLHTHVHMDGTNQGLLTIKRHEIGRKTRY